MTTMDGLTPQSRRYERVLLAAHYRPELQLAGLEDPRNPSLLVEVSDVLWLGVWERNARARAFCARWGFTEVGNDTTA